MCVYETIVLYALNAYSIAGQLHLSKTGGGGGMGRRKKETHPKPLVTKGEKMPPGSI